MPVVLIGREQRTRFSAITIDGSEGVHAAVAHLVARGHTRIGMLDHHTRAETEHPARVVHHGREGTRDRPGPGWSARTRPPTAAGRRSRRCSPPIPMSPRSSRSTTIIIALGALREGPPARPERPERAGGHRLRRPAARRALVEPPLTSVALDTRGLGALAIEQIARLLSGTEALAAEELVVRGELRLSGSA
ncbi:hypothetical protein ACRAWF_38545 [Streptomyces sp. L7]